VLRRPLETTATFRAGADVDLNLQLTDVSERELNAGVNVAVAIGPATAYSWDIRDERGQPVPRVSIPAGRLAIGEAWLRTLKPGEILNDPAYLNRIYAMTEPGKYTVQAFWNVPDCGGQTVASNKITVTIVK